MNNKAIVLDANILIRAVLGKRVRELIVENAATVKFFAPEVATWTSDRVALYLVD
nr:PIN domain-containing protein [uncultured Rhodoferax sp.]